MFRELGRNHRLLMLALFVWALGEGLWYINFKPLYLVELGATEVQVGLALAIEATFRALMPIPAGYVADRIGAQRVMVASWFVGIAGPLVGALAHTWPVFVAGLVFYALSAFAVPSITVYALQNITDRDTPGAADRVLTTVFAVYPAGLVISPLVGGLIADVSGIRTCLWISTAVFAISTLIVMLTRHVESNSIHHGEHPRDLLRNAGFVRMAVYCLLVFIALFVGYQLIPNYLQDVRGLSYSQIGLLFSFSSAGTVVINLVAGRLNPRWNLAAGLAVVWFALLAIWQVPALGILVIAFFGVGAIQVVRTLALARVASVVSEHNHGLAFGAVETILSVSIAVGAGLAGRLYGLTSGHGLPFVVALVTLPVAFGLWFVVRTWLPLASKQPGPSPAPVPAD